MPAAAHLVDLQNRIRRIERGGAARRGVLRFGVAALDAALPEGGLALGALHEILGAGPDEEDAAAAAGFAAAIAGRLRDGVVLWCLKRHDLYGPGLAVHGLDLARVAIVRAARDDDILWALEEGLRAAAAGGIAAVVGEVGRLPMVASRRLQLAAERSGGVALVVRRWSTGDAAAAERMRPSAATTRWRVAPLPSAADGEPGLAGFVGRPRWRLTLLRCRGGKPGEWDMPVDLGGDWGGADASDPVHLPAALAARPAAPRRAAAGRERRRAAG